jgi:hypothetical protein
VKYLIRRNKTFSANAKWGDSSFGLDLWRNAFAVATHISPNYILILFSFNASIPVFFFSVAVLKKKCCVFPNSHMPITGLSQSYFKIAIVITLCDA